MFGTSRTYERNTPQANWPSDVRGGDFSSENYKPPWMPKNGKSSHDPLNQLRNIYKEESPTLNPSVHIVSDVLFNIAYTFISESNIHVAHGRHVSRIFKMRLDIV